MSVRLEIADHVARVTIDRPQVLNALDADAETALDAIWQTLEADRDIRAVVLTGAGERGFCVGADMKNVGRSGLEYWAAARPNGFGGIALRTTLDVPVIARVNGHALGGGFEMVLGCDIVIAAQEAGFGLPEPRVGRLPLDGGMRRTGRGGGSLARRYCGLRTAQPAGHQTDGAAHCAACSDRGAGAPPAGIDRVPAID